MHHLRWGGWILAREYLQKRGYVLVIAGGDDALFVRAPSSVYLEMMKKRGKTC